jgi:hypothetical protein
MSSLLKKLTNFESHLQALFEGGKSSVAPGMEEQSRIGSSLVSALQHSIKIDPLGRRIAADTYILSFDQETCQLISDDQGTIDALLQLISNAAQDSSAIFQMQPRIKVNVDNSMEHGRFEISASFGMQASTETSTLAIDSSQGLAFPESAFLIINGNQVYPLSEQVLNLGRRSDNHIVLPDPRVSRRHAQIRVINHRYVIFDLDSTGGTFVNRVPVNQSTLFPGDVISLAGVELIYGQDASYLSTSGGDSTQPLMPYPNM